MVKDGDDYRLDYDRPKSIGRVRAFFGNTGVLVRAYCYIRTHGPDGLRRVSENAVLNANYLLSRVKHFLPVPQGDRCMHEFVASAAKLKSDKGISAMDLAKRLLDYGFHAPTVYFPLTVKESIMIEPTETESKRNARRLRRDAVPHHRGRRPTCCTTRRTPRRSAGRTKCRPPGSRCWFGRRRDCAWTTCRLIIDPPAPGAWNMAVDEALLADGGRKRRRHAAVLPVERADAFARLFSALRRSPAARGQPRAVPSSAGKAAAARFCTTAS